MPDAELVEWADYLDEMDAAILLGYSDGAEYGSLAPVTFPATQLRIRVELYLDTLGWVDVSQYVLYRYRVVISRGRKPNQRRATAAACALTFRNDDGRFSPRNITGPYFGLLRRNTPLRVWVNPGSGDSLRFTGKVPSWQPWLGAHVNYGLVPVIAYGVRNRLERTTAPTASAQRRYLTAADTLSYRSLEDDLPDRVDGPPGSDRLPDLARGGAFSDNVPFVNIFHGVGGFRPGQDGSVRIEVDVKWPLDPGDTPTLSSALRWNTTGLDGGIGAAGITAWSLEGSLSGTGTGPVLVWLYADGSGSAVGPSSAASVFDGLWHHWRIDLVQNGAAIDVTIARDGDATYYTTSIASARFGHVTTWYTSDVAPGNGARRNPAIGHVAFYGPVPSSSQSYQAFTGWVGETPATRWLRLLAEEDIDASVDELYVDSILMGAQGLKSLPALLDECESAAEGLADETFDNQLRLSTLRSRFNGAVMLTIDAAGEQITPAFMPADDDERVCNDWTISRPGGGTAQYEKTTGALNVNNPEDDSQGIGRYANSDTVNVMLDDNLFDVAGWRVHRDTVDEPRYPSIRFNLARSSELIPQWLRCDIGARALMVNGPDDVGPDDADGILEGYVETFDQVGWEVDAYLEPASVYRVGLVAPDAGWTSETPRLDCGGTTIGEANGLTTTETLCDVTITDNCVWTHDFGDYVVTIGGEDCLLTAVGAVGGAYPAQTQTLTLQRSYNGVVTTHEFGEEIHVKYPIILAR